MRAKPLISIGKSTNQHGQVTDSGKDERVGQVCETNQLDELLLLTEKLLDQIETDSGVSARCTALFQREFAVENTVKQIVAALSATEAGRP